MISLIWPIWCLFLIALDTLLDKSERLFQKQILKTARVTNFNVFFIFTIFYIFYYIYVILTSFNKINYGQNRVSSKLILNKFYKLENVNSSILTKC